MAACVCFQLREFDSCLQDTSSWLAELQCQVDSLSSQSDAEERLHSAQVRSKKSEFAKQDVRLPEHSACSIYTSASCTQDIMKSRPDGDSKVQEVRRRGQNLCSQDLVEPKKQELEQKVKGIEERWTNILHGAKDTLDHAEKKCALENQLRSFKDMSDTTRAWLQDKQQSLDTLDLQTDPERKISVAQVGQNIE